jgi:mannitol/fructose-specific phosphotransferase system IIA component (Ntr-type)
MPDFPLLLSELIQEDVIKVGLEAKDKWEAITELVDLLVAAHEIRIADRASVIEAVFARERSMTTGLKYGLAVPHGSVDSVKEIIAALGTAPRGIPFESVDDSPARLVILLVIPKGALQQHVRTLAGVSRLATGEDLRGRLVSATSAEEVMRAIRELEGL